MPKPQLTVIMPHLLLPENLETFQTKIARLSQLNINLYICLDSNEQELIDNFRTSMVGAPNLRVFASDSRSPGLTRNLGLEQVATDYFTFWDSDDVIDYSAAKDYLGEVGLETSDLLISSFKYANSKAHGWTKSRFLNFCLLSNSPGIWRVTFKREKFQSLRFSNLGMGEDVVYLTEAFSISNCVRFTNSSYYTYIRPEKNTQSHSIRNKDQVPIFVNEYLKKFEAHLFKSTQMNALLGSVISSALHNVRIFSRTQRNEMTNQLMRLGKSDLVKSVFIFGIGKIATKMRGLI